MHDLNFQRDAEMSRVDIAICCIVRDPEITDLVDTTDITLIPTINPDGFDRGEEGACSGADYRTGRFNEGHD